MIDNGIGLPKENRSRLLEPYVTTREKGTGLGLAIVGRILETTAAASSSAMPPTRYPVNGEHGCGCASRRSPRARSKRRPRQASDSTPCNGYLARTDPR